LRFSRKRQDGSAPNFFQGLENTCLLNLHRNTLHPAFKVKSEEEGPMVSEK